MARRVRPHPNAWVTPAGSWPDGPFRDDAPPYAHAVAAMSRSLIDALARVGMTQRGAARAAGLTPSTVNNLIRGVIIPDAATIAALEYALNESLWPERPANP